MRRHRVVESLPARMLRWFRQHPAASTVTAKTLYNVLKDRTGTVSSESIAAAIDTLAAAGYGVVKITPIDVSRNRVEFTVHREKLSTEAVPVAANGLTVGDYVESVTGTVRIVGVLVSLFTKRSGEARAVVENRHGELFFVTPDELRGV
jgi:hypothetical protein